MLEDFFKKEEKKVVRRRRKEEVLVERAFSSSFACLSRVFVTSSHNRKNMRPRFVFGDDAEKLLDVGWKGATNNSPFRKGMDTERAGTASWDSRKQERGRLRQEDPARNPRCPQKEKEEEK